MKIVRAVSEEKAMDYDTPLPHFNALEDALHSLFGENIKIVKKERIAGGDINEAWGLVLSDGSRMFMKCNEKKNLPFFTAEAMGLSAIAKTGAIGAPRVFCSVTDQGAGGYPFSFLLMEFITNGRAVKNYWETFAYELAAMHKAGTAGLAPGGIYGFAKDNYIGAGKQNNTAYDSFIDFFRECRLKPQFKRAAAYFDERDTKNILRLLERLKDILAEPDAPSLLHGDLWAGNVIRGNDGKAWLIDPAVYVGHPEADLAMTELFGGFPTAFYSAYKEAMPLQPGYEKRRDLYNLYHLLNHLNLFGRSYLPPVKGIIMKYIS